MFPVSNHDPSRLLSEQNLVESMSYVLFLGFVASSRLQSKKINIILLIFLYFVNLYTLEMKFMFVTRLSRAYVFCVEKRRYLVNCLGEREVQPVR